MMSPRIAYLREEKNRVSRSGDFRPIITSLNGDGSCLWSFPRPLEERGSVGKTYFHIVFEPWLAGPTSQFGSWFVHISLSTPAAISTAEAVDDLIREIEESIAPSTYHPTGPLVDAIILGNALPDHFHEPTLRMFDSRIPIIAHQDAVTAMKPWNHFTDISLIPTVTADTTSRQDLPHPSSLPKYISPILIPGHAFTIYCFALIWTHSSSTHELILQTPHGISLPQAPFLTTFLKSTPSLISRKPLALFHGLKENYSLGWRKEALGIQAGLALWRRLGGCEYFVVSHDSVLQYSGMLLNLLWVTDVPRTLEWALGLEREKDGKEGELRPEPVRVGNGEGLVLV